MLFTRHGNRSHESRRRHRSASPWSPWFSSPLQRSERGARVGRGPERRFQRMSHTDLGGDPPWGEKGLGLQARTRNTGQTQGGKPEAPRPAPWASSCAL